MNATRRFSRASSYALFLMLTISTMGLSPAINEPQRNGPIVVLTNSGGSWQLYRIDPDGSHFKAITAMAPTTYNDWFPQVSNDGQIAFTYGDGSGPTDIYIVNVDGTGLWQFTHDGRSLDAYWSPDGRDLIYETYNPNNGRPSYLVSAPVRNPSHKTVLTSDLYASWYGLYTPKGRHIIYSTTQGGALSVTSIMDVDGRNKRPLTDPQPDFCPYSVSPDNKDLLLNDQCNTDLPVTIWQLNLVNSQLNELTRSSGGSLDLFPTYSPDGNKIAFASNRRHPHSDILDLYVMNADGTDIRLIKTRLTIGGCPDINCVTPTWAAQP